MEREKTCCFTGHRPCALPWGSGDNLPRAIIFKIALKEAIEKAIKSGYVHFISGMAQGVDTIAAELVLGLKKIYPHITLECAIPCTNQSDKWNKKCKAIYEDIKSRADKITLVSNAEYFDGCMQKRNEYMVNNSSMLIAGFNGRGGGTKKTVTYAYMQNLKVEIITP